jgi:hypothetical protein
VSPRPDVGGRPALVPADLVGTWRLRGWVSEGNDGARHPMGQAPEGVLVYTPDGTMITTIGRAGRTPIDGDDMLAGPDDQRLAAMASFVAYSGSFRVDDGDVVHEVTLSLFPNWVGSTQRRHVTLTADGRDLTLSSEALVVRGRVAIQRLAWERVGD